jgi:hypothetical protein
MKTCHFIILNRGKKSSKFWQVIVNYGRFVGCKKQLGFFEFCYELAIANKCAPIFYKNVRFLGKTQNFQARRGRFSHDPKKIFLSSKVLEGLKYAKKRGYQANFEKGRFSSHSIIYSINLIGFEWF